MEAAILERIESRLGRRREDKACGKSFIADKAKCSKTPIQRLALGVAERQPKPETAANGSKARPSKLKSLSSKALIGFMGTLGIGAATYLAIKAKYRAGFEQSAKEAQAIAQNIQLGNVKAKQHTIVFGVGGMAYGEANDATRTGDRIVTAFKMAFSEAKGKDLKMVPIDNNDTNVVAGAKPGTSALDVAKIHFRNIANGRNKTAVNLAAQVIAYGDKYPDRPLVMVGHSYGGMVTHEAQEIIRRARPDFEKRLKSLAFGTQHYGLTQSFGESHTIGSPADPFTANMPTQNLKTFAKVGGHTQGEYFRDPEVQGFVKSMLYQDKKDSVPRLDAPNNCERGERCGETCIDPKEECNLKDVSPEVANAIDDLSSVVLGAIPGYGQIIAAKKLLENGKAALGAAKNPNISLSKKVIMGAIIMAGISYLGYQKYRDHRRNAVAESATIAKTSAKGMPVRDTQKDQITFTLDGTGKGDKQTLKTAMGSSKAFENHEIIDFSESLDDPMELPDDMSDREKKIAREAENAKNNFGALTSGRNNHAVDLAAQILAYREKYPNKRVNIVAHGAGAQVAVEAADIVKKADMNSAQKLKVVNLQAPDYGIYDSVSGTTTVASDRNPTTLLPMKNKITFGVDDSGDGTGFFKNRRSLAYIKGYFQQGSQEVRTTYGQPARTTYTQATSVSAPATAKAQPTNVPRSTFTTSQPSPKPQGNPYEAQEYKTKLYNYENNVRSTEGVIRNLKSKRESIYADLENPALSTETKLELEEAALNITRTLNTQDVTLRGHREKLEAHRKLAAKTDSNKTAQDFRRASLATLKGAILGAGIATFNRKPKSKVMSGGR